MAPLFTAPNAGIRFVSVLSLHFRQIILIAALIFLAALAGSLSRPTGFLAAFWPANAVLAGLLLRNAMLGRVTVLLAAAAGYMAAAALVGDGLRAAALMTLANIVSAATVAALLATNNDGGCALSRPQDVLSLLIVGAVGSAIGAILGGAALMQMLPSNYFDGWSAWFAAELVNYLALMPVVLSWPTGRIQFEVARSQFAPAAALAAAMVLSLVVPHPIAIAFPVPALIWCALSLPMVATAIMVMIYSGLAMLGIKLGLFGFGFDSGLSGSSIMAIHLGIALIALGPVVVASANVERRRQMEQLTRLARYDALTGALTRRAFEEEGQALLQAVAAEHATVAVLLVDVDHFKQVNDSHGHMAGDRVLIAIAAAIRASIRQGDIFGRIGGEEFALVLPRITRHEAAGVADRMRQAVDNLVIVLDSNQIQHVTLSVGVAFAPSGAPEIFETVSLADRAMYDAKRAGRNRIEICEVAPGKTQGH
jgi:diguanylate cyclase (GGDEF)-like protein